VHGTKGSSPHKVKAHTLGLYCYSRGQQELEFLIKVELEFVCYQDCMAAGLYK